MEKEEKLFSSQRGITLIALIITIIVLLILAGITISLVVGDNGVLNQSTKAVERTSHGQVQEQVQMELANYEADKRTGSEKAIDKTSINYLLDDGYLTEVGDYYIVSSEKTNGANLGKGKSKETGDVYVVEEGEDSNWTLSYYDESNDKEPEKLFEFKVDEDPNIIHFTLSGDDGKIYKCKCQRGDTLRDWFNRGPKVLEEICGCSTSYLRLEDYYGEDCIMYSYSNGDDEPSTSCALSIEELSEGVQIEEKEYSYYVSSWI